jgi:hypothetical protein
MQGLKAHDVLMLNRKLLEFAEADWNDSKIRSRSDSLAKLIVEIWPTPDGHKSAFTAEKTRPRYRVDLSVLLSAGCLQVGMTLIPRQKKFSQKAATLLGDGRVDIDGTVYATASEAAKALTGVATNGWWFFLVEKQGKKSLRDVRVEYLESIAAETDEDEGDEDDDDE